VCRKVARLKAEGRSYPRRVTPVQIEKFLGPPQFFNQEAERQDEIGVATGVAWTETGGEIMPVEVALFDGKGNLQITGQIGNVMQESAQAALSYLKTRAEVLKIAADLFDNIDIHIHIPEGAIPKDGPSAGITICSALASAFTGRSIYKHVGMTGEITLRGRVLPVGGLREKVLAAHRAGLKTVIIPWRNEKDLTELPKRARSDLNIKLVNHMDEVLEVALAPAPAAEAKKRIGRARRKEENPQPTPENGQSAPRGESTEAEGQGTA
jgi:ATP-dependent Lon protease